MRPLKLSFCFSLILATLSGLSGCGGEEETITLTPKQEKEVAQRLAPVGEVVLEGDVTAAAPVAAASAEPRSGETIYNKACTTCHTTGAAGAPKFGDVGAWADRIGQGIDTLYNHALNGIRGMPPKGLCMDCSEAEIKATVDYIVSNSQ